MNNTAGPHTMEQIADAPMRRKSIFGSMTRLATASALLIVFILFLGDFRRRQRALDQCTWHASTLTSRLGPDGMLPINLEPISSPQRSTGMLRLEWLDREEARAIRQVDRRCVVAQTAPILQVVGYDGRAVISFEHGQFKVTWMTLSEFERQAAVCDGSPSNGPGL